MPPSKPACRALATGYKLSGEVSEKWRDIKSAIKKIIKLKYRLKYGILSDIADTIGSELSSFAGAVASRVAENVLGSISKMAAGILEQVFGLILRMLLAFPTAIFSLVAIPHDAAKKATRSESLYLRKADENLRRILYIITKWTRGKSGNEFRNKMLEALPFILKSIKLLQDMILSLRGISVNDDEYGANAVFKDSEYSLLKTNLSAAIRVSEPTSSLEQKMRLNERFENEKSGRYKRKADKIKADYGVRRRKLVAWYNTELKATRVDASDKFSTRLVDSAKQHLIGIKYNERLELLNTWKKEKLAAAELAAETETMTNSSTWAKAFSDLGDQFSSDMQLLVGQLEEMLGNIKDAYIQNKLSQLHCNTIYDIRNLIRNLVKQMIAYMRGFGNVAGEGLANSFESAQFLVESSRDKYQAHTNPGFEWSSFEMSSALNSGHITLIAANAILESTVTDSLIDLINSDDVLKSEDEQFDNFLEELRKIKDWDGAIGVWSVDIAHGSVSPYIQLIADITEMLAKVPIMSVRNRASDRRRVKSIINTVRNDFRVLRRHNGVVANTLSSYTPYMGSEAGNLMKLLAGAGLLESFASTMSIAALVTDLASNWRDNFGDEWPTLESCSAPGAYPELFTDDSISRGASENFLNMPDPKLSNETQDKIEDNDNDKEVRHVAKEVRDTNFTDLDNGDDGNLKGYQK